ncbi:hypothetical protein SAM23877_1031 [Streptomyces ambofaciens ATCC 23877]|uniref:Uncharacterized protein n=1 Tax=Streptomyces ambofaciens (strain ATCC 23877 / 3486 / DSM 40053 / JCM 4204 / NBRC 12836 / NRRL B-2516) TaxID=278992 RepID=A0A0K2ALX6_STRA7|nr:hypothetical protein SAM23877_1031 [Streptomyces ambofaciens ATCC 23877]
MRGPGRRVPVFECLRVAPRVRVPAQVWVPRPAAPAHASPGPEHLTHAIRAAGQVPGVPRRRRLPGGEAPGKGREAPGLGRPAPARPGARVSRSVRS